VLRLSRDHGFKRPVAITSAPSPSKFQVAIFLVLLFFEIIIQSDCRFANINTAIMDETKPLMVSSDDNGRTSYNGGGGCPPNGGYDVKEKITSSSKMKWIGPGLVVLAVFGLGMWYGRSTGRDEIASTVTLPPPLPPPTSDNNNNEVDNEEPPATLRYRPFCMVHDKKVEFAGILQTSMGAPSQQWSHIPCYAQPEKVRMWAGAAKGGGTVNINGFGAPDAILRTNFSRPAFPKRPPIVGFGAAFTEAASLNYRSLSDVGKERLMELFFGKSGLGYSIGRVHINSCDFSIKSYSFDETDGDFELKDFDMNVTHDAQKDGMIDMMLRATAVFNQAWQQGEETNTGVDDGEFKMFASPWSPPSWMKSPWSDNDIIAGKAHATGMTGSLQPSCLREGTAPGSKYAKAWALYFSKFISACE
jgi:glucosylceramidase